MGYSIRSRYRVVQDESDRAARRAERDTSGMWKGVPGDFYPALVPVSSG